MFGRTSLSVLIDISDASKFGKYIEAAVKNPFVVFYVAIYFLGYDLLSLVLSI